MARHRRLKLVIQLTAPDTATTMGHRFREAVGRRWTSGQNDRKSSI
jgi:hypothetical protein